MVLPNSWVVAAGPQYPTYIVPYDYGPHIVTVLPSFHDFVTSFQWCQTSVVTYPPTFVVPEVKDIFSLACGVKGQRYNSTTLWCPRSRSHPVSFTLRCTTLCVVFPWLPTPPHSLPCCPRIMLRETLTLLFNQLTLNPQCDWFYLWSLHGLWPLTCSLSMHTMCSVSHGGEGDVCLAFSRVWVWHWDWQEAEHINPPWQDLVLLSVSQVSTLKDFTVPALLFMMIWYQSFTISYGAESKLITDLSKHSLLLSPHWGSW